MEKKFKFDYTKCMMMKLLMAVPDGKGGSTVHCNFERAMEIIIKTNILTCGIKKIIYLIGWQYNGHDDKYPAFFKVNEALKCRDKSAHESMLWLIRESKKHNTIISVHINFADAYENSSLFDEYLQNNCYIRNSFGKPAKIEKYNNITCYKIDYKAEWESGLFHKRVEKLLQLLPLEAIGTIHIDNFQCYVNRKPKVSISEMQEYRNKMINYFNEKGIDITTEFTYREGPLTKYLYGKVVRDLIPTHYPIALLNIIPAVWWVDKMTIIEYYEFYPHIYGGGIPKNKKAFKMLYGNIHGEESWKDKESWEEELLRKFATINVPFFFLNSKRRLKLNEGRNLNIEFEDGVISYANGDITQYGKFIKKGQDLCIYLPQIDGYIAYSEKDSSNIYFLGNYSYAFISKISVEGLSASIRVKLDDGYIKLSLKAKEACLIKVNKF